MATFTIAAGAAVSSAVDFGPNNPIAPTTRTIGFIQTSSANWDAAALAFKGSLDGVTYYPIKTAGSLVTIAAIAEDSIQYVTLPRWRWLKLWSETSGSDVLQTYAITIQSLDS